MNKADALMSDRTKFDQLVDENRRLSAELEKLKNNFPGSQSSGNINSSELLSELASASLQGIIILGEQNIEFCNDRAREINGVPDSILQAGKPWMDFFNYQMDRGDFGEGEVAQKFLDDLVANFKNREVMQIERKASDGKIVRADRIPNSIGGMTLTLTDITDLKNTQAKLETSMRAAKMAESAKSEFLANMSHEIRTPMNGVMGMAELLATTKLDQKQAMFTDVIVKSGASLLTIINDILDFSKIDAGQMELVTGPFDLVEAIEDVAVLVSSKVAEKDLEMIVRANPALPRMVVGDAGRVRQVITNLLGNAVKFTDEGSVFLNVDGTVNDDKTVSLQFYVQDTGIGIPEEQIDHVFQKFSQVDASATRKHEGTGLGLSITSSLIDLMGGEIGVESEVGVGSKFWFNVDFPVHAELESKQQHVISQDLEGARILIIDDNAVNRSILTEQMASWNFESVAASSGREGLDIASAVGASDIDLDLVILDFQMPEMSGDEVLASLRSNKVTCDIPVLMLTSVDSSDTIQRLNDLGAEENLTKPVRSTFLLDAILKVITNSRNNKLRNAQQHYKVAG